MAKQTARSKFLATLKKKGGDKAFDAHKADETVFSSGGNLPPGIEGGVAQLVDCKFDVFKKGKTEGEYFFFASGVVKEPKQHNGVRVEGLRTSIIEPMCDTPGRSREDVDAHLEWVLNEMRKLGVNTAELDVEDLEETVADLREAKPHFRFRTWQGSATKQFPNPRVNETWNGTCEYDGEDAEDDVVESSTDDVE